MGNAPGGKSQKHHERRVPPPIRHCGRLPGSLGPIEVSNVQVARQNRRKYCSTGHQINRRQLRTAGLGRNPDRGVQQYGDATEHPENTEQAAKSACGGSILVVSNLGHNRLRKPSSDVSRMAARPSVIPAAASGCRTLSCVFQEAREAQGLPQPAFFTLYPACSVSSTSSGRMRSASRNGNTPLCARKMRSVVCRVGAVYVGCVIAPCLVVGGTGLGYLRPVAGGRSSTLAPQSPLALSMPRPSRPLQAGAARSLCWRLLSTLE